jgi:thiamine-monophosphate kinase
MQDISRHFGVQLVGGDVTRGSLSLTITAFGHVSNNQALTRSGAFAGDLIYVTGFIGDAAGGLALHQRDIETPSGDEAYLIHRLNRPSPRVAAGLGLRGICNACIDVSDGLLADLSHMLKASDKGANIYLDELPLSDALVNCFGRDKSIEMALNGGDDYELCFTIPDFNQGAVETNLANAGVSFRCIGRVVGKPGLNIEGYNKEQGNFDGPKGYRHF